MVFRSSLLCAALVFLVTPLQAREKTDIVTLKNGDRVTGEVVKLEAGILEFKTDTMGRIFIEWRHIAKVVSDMNHSVETREGTRWLGYLEKPEAGENIVVNTVRGPVELVPGDVVAVWPVEATFWDKLDLDISLGVDYASSTHIRKLNSALDIRYATLNRLTEGSLRSNITRQSSAGDDQTRVELRFDHQRLLAEQRFINWLATAEQNDALGVDVRLAGGSTFGKYFMKTNNVWLTAAGGVQVVNENPSGGSGAAQIEGVLAGRFRYFRYADPERSFDTTLSLYPGLSEWGRLRGDLRSTFKLEFFRDLFWALEVYYTHDNEPLNEDADKSDYGVTTSLGWSY